MSRIMISAIAPSIATSPRLCFDGSRLGTSGSLHRNRNELGAFASEGNPRKGPRRRMWLPKNSVRSENTGVPIIREIMVATTMSSLFVADSLHFSNPGCPSGCDPRASSSTCSFPRNAPRRLRLHRCDRLLWVVLYRCWSGWRRCLEIVQPDTVLRWHRRAFAWHWTRKSRRPSRQARSCGQHS
jgi:hypothetical protein